MRNIFIIVALFFWSCNISNNQKDNIEQNKSEKKDIVFEIIRLEEGWGYKIFVKNKLYIFQKNIPGIQGMKGFTSKEKAHKAAIFIVSKIESGVLPPSISINELDSLGVLY